MVPLDYHVPNNGRPLSATTTIVVGGEPMKLPIAFFVPAEIAWVVVESFHRTGDRTPELKWVRLDDQVWDYR
jgi:hypothetical protein